MDKSGQKFSKCKLHMYCNQDQNRPGFRKLKIAQIVLKMDLLLIKKDHL